MSEARSRLGASNLSVPLMLLTFVAIGGLLWWLNLNAVATEVEMPESEDDSSALASMYQQVTEEQLTVAAAQLEGVNVRITHGVAEQVGTQAFFLDLFENPFLVRVPETWLAGGQPVPSTGTVQVMGTLHAMTDSIRQAWVDQGLIGEADRILVDFATHFIEAHELETDVAPPVEAPAP